MILEKTARYTSFKLTRAAAGAAARADEGLIEQLCRLQTLYRGGMRQLCAQLEFIDDQFRAENDHDPIHHMECRMKTVESILEKAERHGLPLTVEAIRTGVRDIAGVRVICNYIDDVYRLAELIMARDDLTVVRVSDYIAKPKENGYRSLHIVVQLPVRTSAGVTEDIPVEIQLRTVAMDAWASLEHEMMYKSDRKAVEIDRMKLKICADELAGVDRYMQEIYKQLEPV